MCICCVWKKMPGNSSSRNHTHIRKKEAINNNKFFCTMRCGSEEEATKHKIGEVNTRVTLWAQGAAKSAAFEAGCVCLNCIKPLSHWHFVFFLPSHRLSLLPSPFSCTRENFIFVFYTASKKKAYLKHKICIRPATSRFSTAQKTRFEFESLLVASSRRNYHSVDH